MAEVERKEPPKEESSTNRIDKVAMLIALQRGLSEAQSQYIQAMRHGDRVAMQAARMRCAQLFQRVSALQE